ncbi:DNA-binding NarL/FixJ family response regulator [Saccharopolyspora lacisalsi]|uniref:DNA-binding NarL/FixJ family response regulator n=1 Tax=Halosaccharopolyspora lacisalsi TaxID=1000566 RepID=A0A839E0H8_9PSEU|nr:response regulator transcription factor [Halosaccharopolyspora lacisalsi]MBA8826026.1 DNA-binding NarL/FixJ family response regulator [Halosaccharopolyspora lacisalsi]
MRVLLAEDSVVLREGLARLLAARGHEVVGEVGDAEMVAEAVDARRPDVVVADVRMPPTHTDDGLRAARRIRAQHPEIGILVFSQYVETHYATKLLADGADGVGYLLKDRVSEVSDFVDALEQVVAGGTVLDPEVVSRLMGGTGPSTLAALTPREREVLALMAEGRSNTAVSAELVVTAGAVEKYVAGIFDKLGLHSDQGSNRRVLAVLRYLQGC